MVAHVANYLQMIKVGNINDNLIIVHEKSSKIKWFMPLSIKFNLWIYTQGT
jgi:hypothetical protein